MDGIAADFKKEISLTSLVTVFGSKTYPKLNHFVTFCLLYLFKLRVNIVKLLNNSLKFMLLGHKVDNNLSLKPRESEIPLQQYERGDEISVSSLGIWQVYRGVVQLSRVQPDGKEIVLGWVAANGTFGSCYELPAEPYRAVALANVYIRHYLPHDVVRHPLLARQFLAQFSDRLIVAEELLSIIAIRKVEERLIQLLLMLKKQIGQPVEEEIRLQVRFTHQQLAEAICTTRVTITRILGDFQARGLIAIDNERHIVFKDLGESY